ncbi:hypothetical protein TIFTF001_041862 [Ficus carica]|uniref:Uncharacterized protein n=1 Tax=Ficus carica TaxID=3494 RepID=A0AA88CX50_FICCA|nr:hypothetical protein TIFTF001_041862 [Ficus carica]
MPISMKNGENLYKIKVEEMKNGSEFTDHPASVNPDRKRGELKRFKFQGKEDTHISLVRVHNRALHGIHIAIKIEVLKLLLVVIFATFVCHGICVPVHWLVIDDYRWFGHRPTPVDSGKYETEHRPTKSETGRAPPDEIRKRSITAQR